MFQRHPVFFLFQILNNDVVAFLETVIPDGNVGTRNGLQVVDLRDDTVGAPFKGIGKDIWCMDIFKNISSLRAAVMSHCGEKSLNFSMNIFITFGLIDDDNLAQNIFQIVEFGLKDCLLSFRVFNLPHGELLIFMYFIF